MNSKILNEPDYIKVDGIVLNTNCDTLTSYRKLKAQQIKINELENKINYLESLIISILKEQS